MGKEMGHILLLIYPTSYFEVLNVDTVAFRYIAPCRRV